MRMCSVEGCGKKHEAHGLCATHYQKAKISGNAGNKRPCSVDGCGGFHFAKSYCKKHYRKFLKYGSPFHAERTTRPGEPSAMIRNIPETNECVLWPFSRDDKGYGRCNINIDGVRYQRAHRLALALMIPPPSEDSQALHSCHNGHLGCYNPRHLYWGDGSDNQIDRCHSGRKFSKLTNHDAGAIKAALKKDADLKIVADMFLVSLTTVYDIKRGRTWSKTHKRKAA